MKTKNLIKCISYPHSSYVKSDIPIVSVRGNIENILNITLERDENIHKKEYIREVLNILKDNETEFIPYKFDSIRLTWNNLCLLEIDNMHTESGRIFTVSLSDYKKLMEEREGFFQKFKSWVSYHSGR